MQVAVRVLYLDRTTDGGGSDGSTVNEHDFVPEALAGAALVIASTHTRSQVFVASNRYDPPR